MTKLSDFTARNRQSRDERQASTSTANLVDGLTEDERSGLEVVHRLAAQFVDALHVIGGTDPDEERLGSRHIALSRNHVEDAVSRVVLHIESRKRNRMP